MFEYIASLGIVILCTNLQVTSHILHQKYMYYCGNLAT